jgi:hypothetical protein
MALRFLYGDDLEPACEQNKSKQSELRCGYSNSPFEGNLMNLNCRMNIRGWLVCHIVFSGVLIAGLAGCGPNLAQVDGTVTFKGEKVKGGMLFFSPEAGDGAPAAATVEQDGTFVLKTGDATGASLGKSKITYSPPSGEASTDPNKEGTASPYVGLVPKDATVEIKPGKNTFNIELTPGN